MKKRKDESIGGDNGFADMEAMLKIQFASNHIHETGQANVDSYMVS